MLDKTANTSGMESKLAGRSIPEGTTVYDAGGDKVGTVSEHNTQGGYLVVHKGRLVPKDVYVPLNAIGGADADGVYLHMYKDDLKNQNWDNPPAGAATLTGSPRGTGNISDKAMSPDLGAYPHTVMTPPREDSALSGIPTQVQQSDAAMPIREESQSINVPVSREEVRAERVPVEGARSEELGPDAFQDKDIDVPIMGERVNVEKQARVGEELRLHKREITEQVKVEGPDQQGNMSLSNAENVTNVPPNSP